MYYNDVVANFTTLTIADDIILAGVYSYGDFIPSHQTYIGNNAGSITVESPPVPNIQCYALEDNAITVSWQGSSIYSYCVYRNGVIGPTTPTNSIPGVDGTQMAEFTGLDPFQSYPFHIEIKLNDIVGHTTASMMCVTTCILPGAKVLTANGAKLIEDIRSGEVVLDEFGNRVEVSHNIMFGIGGKMVVTFEANSLGDNVPDEKLSITYIILITNYHDR